MSRGSGLFAGAGRANNAGNVGNVNNAHGVAGSSSYKYTCSVLAYKIAKHKI